MLARAEDELVDFECGVADLLCGSMEDAGNWVADAIKWLADTALGSQSFRPGDALWNTAQAETGRWLGMAILVMAITFIVGLAGGAVLQRPDLIKRTVLATAASLPAFYFSYFIVGQGLLVIDEFSGGLLDRLTGKGGFATMIETLFSGQANWGAHTVGTIVGAPPVAQMMLVLGVMACGLFFIMFAMAFRDFVLMILVAFAPLAFVLLPAKGTSDDWMKRWMSAVTAMALAKPLILGTLVLVMAGFGKVETIWSGAGLSLAIGVFITAFMPILAYSFFQWMGGGGGGDHVGERAGGEAKQKTQKVVSAVGRRLPNGKGGGGGRGSGSTPPKNSTKTGSSSTSSSTGAGTKQGGTGKPPVKDARPGQGPAAAGTFGGDAGSPSPKPAGSPPPKMQRSGSSGPVQVPEPPKTAEGRPPAPRPSKGKQQ
ncbi:hypothetical protein ACFWHR_12155 [Leucobacter sp. NPDC058333]|uniref:hypothetical protein n=1 Tax=Leucobacter sp. NPDC058333 TaxID=3346450 RepID=UPI0036571F0D